MGMIEVVQEAETVAKVTALICTVVSTHMHMYTYVGVSVRRSNRNMAEVSQL